MHRIGLLVAALLVGFVGAAMAETFTIDLTHPIPTFKPMAGDALKPDLAQPWLDSKPVPTFGQQTVFSISEFPTNEGHFDLGQLVLSEHHGTHLDSPGHYVNNQESQEAAGIPMDQR
jgi:kynurenine formamidase